MTPEPQLVELVSLLMAGQNASRLNWTHTSDPNIFRLILDEGLIRIERIQGSTIEASSPPPYSYGITVLDKSGAEVLGGSDMYSKNDFVLLGILYEQVYYHLHDEAVGKIMNELQSKLSKMPA